MFGKYAYTYYAMLCVCFCWVCLKSELDFGELIPWLIVVGWAFRCYFNFTVLIQQETYQFLLVIYIDNQKELPTYFYSILLWGSHMAFEKSD